MQGGSISGCATTLLLQSEVLSLKTAGGPPSARHPAIARRPARCPAIARRAGGGVAGDWAARSCTPAVLSARWA